MKRNYSTFSIEVIAFGMEDVIRTSGENYTKDIIVGNDEFADGVVDGFGGFAS